MRRYILAIASIALVTLSIAPFSAPASAQGYGRGEGWRQGRSAYRGECQMLRRACLFKEELGERGMGNCRRYREVCRGY